MRCTVRYRRGRREFQIALFAGLLLSSVPMLQAQPDRIRERIESPRTAVLKGHTHPQANIANDQGAVDAAFPMALTLLLKSTPEQRSALETLLAAQRTPASPNYHRWLTPEQYAERFALSTGDIARLSGWLRSQGFAVRSVTRGRTAIVFSGTAEQAGSSFHTTVRRYRVDGKMHFANASDPAIPAALQDIVTGVDGFHDFDPTPDLTSASGVHNLAPADLAAIYNITPLYNAGIDGTGQKIVVVGTTAVDLADIHAFRSRFNLPAKDPEIILVPDLPDPGTNTGTLAEADLDIEWSGAIAPNATIRYVYTRNAFNAITYAINQNLAPVISASYSACERYSGAILPFYHSLAQQANAQGITWVNSAGDAGAAGCDPNGAVIAQVGPAVRFPSDMPEVTGLGGTQFDETGGSYWNSTNDANGGSALSYIPEAAWNEVGVRRALLATGGGASAFFPKPVWQTGPGVPDDNFRHVPDVSLTSAINHDGYAYQRSGAAGVGGGTSFAAPSFAGMLALLNQYLVSTGAQTQSGVGNINPDLYRLAQTAPSAFHDITSGDNRVPCAAGSPGCEGGSFGFSAGPGYDQVTGLGSVDVSNLVHLWTTQKAANSAVVPFISPNPVYQHAPDANGLSWSYTITLTEEAGIGTTLTGFVVDGVDNSSQIAGFFGSATIPPNGKLSSTLGNKNLTVPLARVFAFSGMDASGYRWSQRVTVDFRGPAAVPNITGIANAASFEQAYAPGMILSVFGSQLAPATQTGVAFPLLGFMGGLFASVNSFSAPLYYVSPTQVNIQIPYETAEGEATLIVSNLQATATFKFTVAAAAPGIFAAADRSLVPFASGGRGKTLILFITGEGQVSPALSTGNSPAATTPLGQLPKPRLPVTLTVGGSPAMVTFAGIPSGLVGATQINFVVPSDAPLGVQPVVVKVGDAASPAVNLTVTP